MQLKINDVQRKVIHFLRDKKRAMVIMNHGAGKTVIALSLVHELLYDRFEDYKILIVASKYAVENTWKHELSKWDNFSYIETAFVVGRKRKKWTGNATWLSQTTKVLASCPTRVM